MEPGEACDGTLLGAKTCKTLRFSGGTLACTGRCDLDTTGCYTLRDPGGLQINGAAGAQTAPSVAFGGQTSLVVWEDHRKTSESDIYGAVVDTAGRATPAAGVAIATGPGNQQRPRVATNGKKYLVAWIDWWHLGYEVSGRLVDLAGKASGKSFPIADGTSSNLKVLPAVASDGTDFVVLWDECDNATARCAIMGRKVSAKGIAMGSAPFRVSQAGNSYQGPSLVHDGKHYLAAFHSCASTGTACQPAGDVYGVLLGQDGKPLASPGQVAISATSSAESYAVVAPRPGGGFVVAWLDEPDSKRGVIRAARLDAAGKLLDPTPITASSAPNKAYPVALVHAAKDRFVALWPREAKGQIHLFAARLTGQVKVLDPTAISLCAFDSWKISVASAATKDGILNVWSDYRAGMSNADIYGARLVP